MPPPPLHALITGGSRGIGLAIAQLLARHSYRCTLISRSSADLSSALATLSSPDPETLSRHHSIAGDVSSSAFWAAVAEELATQHASGSRPENDKQSSSHDNTKQPRTETGAIDVLVNCAGRTQTRGFKSMSNEEIEGIVDTNLTGMMVGTRMLLRKRLLRGSSARSGAEGHEDEGGHGDVDGLTTRHSPVIINVASLLGLQGGHGAVAYAASKAGVLGFTRALATESASYGVRVNAVVPGYVETDMTQGLDRDSLTQHIPLRRFGRPEEIASAALFLARNEYAHSCVLNLDGGLSAM